MTITDEERVKYSVAGHLARRVRQLHPGWTETTEGLGHWRFEDPDEDYGGRHVIIDGRERTLRVLPVGEGVHVGPSVIGWCSRVTVNVTLPDVSDRSDMESALEALAAVGALNLREGSVDEARESAGLTEALDNARTQLSLSARDWSTRHDLAWLYGLFVGWDDEPDDAVQHNAMADLATNLGWDAATVERLRQLRAVVARYQS